MPCSVLYEGASAQCMTFGEAMNDARSNEDSLGSAQVTRVRDELDTLIVIEERLRDCIESNGGGAELRDMADRMLTATEAVRKVVNSLLQRFFKAEAAIEEADPSDDQATQDAAALLKSARSDLTGGIGALVMSVGVWLAPGVSGYDASGGALKRALPFLFDKSAVESGNKSAIEGAQEGSTLDFWQHGEAVIIGTFPGTDDEKQAWTSGTISIEGRQSTFGVTHKLVVTGGEDRDSFKDAVRPYTGKKISWRGDADDDEEE